MNEAVYPILPQRYVLPTEEEPALNLDYTLARVNLLFYIVVFPIGITFLFGISIRR